MKTNVKLIVGVVAGFVAGCAVGMFIPGNLETSADSGKGDITNVSKLNKNVMGSTKWNSVGDKLKNNPQQMIKTSKTLTALTKRMAEFEELVEMTALACEGNANLASSVDYLKTIQDLSKNARFSGIQTSEALLAVAKGESSAIDFDQAARSLSTASLLADRQNAVGKQFVCDVDAFLRDKNPDEFLDISLARDLWANFCGIEISINNDGSEF